jgi:hypothetical protein
MVSAVAPAIFQIGNPPVAAVTNQDNTLNALSNLLVRGQTRSFTARVWERRRRKVGTLSRTPP